MTTRSKISPPARKGMVNRQPLSCRVAPETKAHIKKMRGPKLQLSEGEVVDRAVGHAKRTEFQPVSLL